MKMANRPDLSLDPLTWGDIRQLGHRMVDDMFDYLENIREAPVWRPVPPETLERLDEDLPFRPMHPAEVYDMFRQHILPYPQGNIHPRFWGWVMGSGTPVGILAEMLAATMNANVCLGDHAAIQVEQQVLKWCKQLLEYPESASGLLTSGASMANLTALVVARNYVPDSNIRRLGVQAEPSRMVLYCSTETHSCIQKAAETMGLGAASICRVPVDEAYRIRLDLLEQFIQNDLAAGRLPFCVVGNAGTVNTGAIDPLDEILALCRRYDLWFHVDGAFGALAKRVPGFEAPLRAIEQADSVAFDLHKWLHIPYEAGCVLIRNADAHRQAFAQAPNYLLQHERGVSAGEHTFGNLGVELSRGFKALKVWMSLKTYGAFAFIGMIRQNMTQAQYLAAQVQQTECLELMAPATMNIVCFRFKWPNAPADALQAVNKEILMHLQEKGIATVSATVLEGRYALRAAICNHRTRQSDLDLLLESVVRIGNGLVVVGAA